MSLYDELIAAGLPILSATESGETVWSTTSITFPQIALCNSIIKQYCFPEVYASDVAFKSEADFIKGNYHALDVQLQNCIDRPNPNSADIHNIAVVLQALLSERISQMPDHPAHPPRPPHGGASANK